MLVLGCLSAVVPCPVADQVWVSSAEVIDFASLGVDAASILKFFAWGFTPVLAAFVIGILTAVAVGLIRKV